MKCSVYVATSADGYIASPDGGVDWLNSAGNMDADMGDEDMGYREYIDSVDCMVMGRKCMEMIANMNLSPEQWMYGYIPIFALSTSVKKAPKNLEGKVEMYSGKIKALVSKLKKGGFKHAYIDGGTTITSFLNHGLINEMTITRAPILLGEGLPLFGKMDKKIKLENTEAKLFLNNFYQVKYTVSYS